jgi:hypothetical protein
MDQSDEQPGTQAQLRRLPTAGLALTHVRGGVAKRGGDGEGYRHEGLHER